MGAGYPEAGALAAAELEGREPTGPCAEEEDDALPLLTGVAAPSTPATLAFRLAL